MEQTSTTQTSEVPVNPERPGFLTALCVLSYIGSGFWALISFICIFFIGWFISFLENVMSGGAQMEDIQDMDPETMERLYEAAQKMKPILSLGTAGAIGLFVLAFALAVTSLVGVAKMWKLKKSGYWIYLVANVSSLIMSIAFFGSGIGTIIIALGFIAMYSVNLKHLQ